MGSGNQNSSTEGDLESLIRARIERLRPKLLDLSRRNPLISTRLSGRANSYIRVVDELPDVLYYGLFHGQAFRFGALPALDEDPKDEETDEFQATLSEARLTDEDYAEALEQIDPADESAIEKQREAERALRDRVRETLGMPPRQTRNDLSLVQHARNNGISPSYELPLNEERHDDGRHDDDIIQTLLLPDHLERSANRLIAKCRSWQQETGLNVMHAAFGFLEWEESASNQRSFSPLILLPIAIERRKTSQGPEFLITGLAEPGEMNNVLAEKLRLELDVELPTFDSGSIEDYLMRVANAAPRGIDWKVRRYVAFGVFPSARLAMYYDLETTRPEFATNEIVDQLLGGRSPDPDATPFAEEYEVDDPDIEGKVPLLITEADSSQFSTMVDIAKGDNLAVEGPPGTGKSQTIINTIAAALSEGKKVLFCAEKMAALDVVRARLEHMHLGKFLLPLQANRSSREQVVASIRERLDLKQVNTPKDYSRQVREFQKARDELAIYIDLISSRFRDTDFTIHDILGGAILTADALEGLPRSLQAPSVTSIDDCDRHRIEEIKILAEDLEDAWKKAASAMQYWNGLSIEGLDRFTADGLLESGRE